MTAPNGFDVVVVGGGLVGAALAYELVTAGARVALVDRHDPGRATDAGAGILSPETMSQADPIWFELAMGAGEHYRDLVPALDSDGIRSTGYAVTGLLRVGFREWEDDLFAANIALARERCPEEVEEITTDEARRRFPPLGDIRNAWYSRRAARVDGRSMTTALLEVALTAGLTVIDDTVDSVERGTGRVAGVTTAAGRPLSAGAVVIAGGAWTPAVADQLSVSIPVAPVRGQIVHVRLEGADTSSWPIVSPLLSQYILPWPDGRLVVGATVEPDAGFDARVDRGGHAPALRRDAAARPGARGRDVRGDPGRTAAGERRRRAVLGRLPGWDNAYVCTGHGANGLLLGPYSAHLVAALVSGRRPAMDIAPFGVERFADDSGAE